MFINLCVAGFINLRGRSRVVVMMFVLKLYACLSVCVFAVAFVGMLA